MDRDASLDEFLSGESTTDEPAGNAADGDPGEPAAESAGPAVEPAISTYGWAPEGAECGGCGTAVEERWRDGDVLVCEECKEW